VAVTAGDPLHVMTTGAAVVAASEPYDDDAGWEPIPDASLIEATPGDVTCIALHRKGTA
jgi:glutamine amidotransferase